MTNFCTDVGFVSINKHGEQLCGDHVEIVPGDKLTVAVLADGMGSGVKANILSTLTAKILSTMIASSLPVEDCVATIAATLPICKVRNMAYSTFTIIRITDNLEAEIIQYDNPWVILLREGRNFEYGMITETIDGKRIYKTKLTLKEHDTFIAVSDGAVHAGTGQILNYHWQRGDIIQFMEKNYNPDFTAKTLSSILLDKCYSLYHGVPGDDTTVCTVKIRGRETVNLLIGPPAKEEDVQKMMTLFFSRGGKHVVCGGTTSNLAAQYLNKPLDTSVSQYADPTIPPIARIPGVDLVTEGVITMHQVLDYARDCLVANEMYPQWNTGQDGASQIARILFKEASDINFYVGRAVNPAHNTGEQQPGGALNMKIRLIEELADCLRAMGKRVKLSYF